MIIYILSNLIKYLKIKLYFHWKYIVTLINEHFKIMNLVYNYILKFSKLFCGNNNIY